MSIFPEGKESVPSFLVVHVPTTVSNTEQVLSQCLISGMTDSRESALIFLLLVLLLCLSHNEKGHF